MLFLTAFRVNHARGVFSVQSLSRSAGEISNISFGRYSGMPVSGAQRGFVFLSIFHYCSYYRHSLSEDKVFVTAFRVRYEHQDTVIPPAFLIFCFVF